MKKDRYITKVMFVMEKDGDGVMAFFPELHYHHEGHPLYNQMFECYAHVGQHSGCHIEYFNECEAAKTEQYADLKAELEGLGYRLQVVEWCRIGEIEMHRNPTTYELKIGRGATHYRTFTTLQVGWNKKGKLKKRIKADDGLYYSR